MCAAEIVEWWEKPKPTWNVPPLALQIAKPLRILGPEREKVSVRIDVPEIGKGEGLAALYVGRNRSHTLTVYRDDLPTEVLRPHENRKNMPDIAGREFQVLICEKPEFETLFPAPLKPREAEKDAWAMLREFFDLDESDWVWSLRRFLNRWGLWSYERGFDAGMMSGDPTPGFVLVYPHLLRQKRDEYRKAIETRSARKWLSTARALSFTTIDKPPYFLVERFYCEDAIQATITIEHLAERRWGFCKRCGKVFEHKTEHKKNYCSRRCIGAAGVKRWREKQRKGKWTAAKIAKLLRQQGAKRNAKG